MNKTSSQENSNLLKDEENFEQPQIRDENEEAKKKQRTKCIAISVGIAVAIAILIVILVLVLKKSSSPDTPPGPADSSINPYNVMGLEPSPEAHGINKFILKRDTAINSADGLAVGGNTYVDDVTVSAQLLNYQTARISIYETNNFHQNYHVPEDFISEDILKDYEKGVFFNHLGFQVANQNKFFMRLYDHNNKLDYATTEGQSLLVMKYYIQIGYKLESQRLFGLGERTTNFQLSPGTYVIYPQSNPGKIDSGANTEPSQQSGMHPFLMAQLRDKTFFGVYFFNSNPQQITISYSQEQVSDGETTTTKYFSHVTFTANGGSLDTFYFIGPSYQDVLRQYHNLIGKPKMGPLMAHGLFLSNDDVYADAGKLDSIINFFKNGNIPLEGAVISPLKTDNQYQFNLNYPGISKISDLNTKYPHMKWIYPWGPHYPAGEIPAQMKGKGLLLTVNDKELKINDSVKKNGYCFDYFSPNAVGYLDSIFTNNFNPQFTGLWLYHNNPSFTSTEYDGQTQPPEINPFGALPFWPGQSATYTGSVPSFTEAHVHQDGDKWTKQYMFYLHGIYGTQMASQLQTVLSENSKVMQGLIVSESTFPGAGAKAITHVFPKQDLTTQSLKYAAAQILNFNMFGMPYASPNICGYSRGPEFTPELESLCVRSFQLGFVTPFAVYNSNSVDIDKLSEAGQRQVQSNLEARLSFVMYTRTELYKIQNIGGALVRPLFAEYANDIGLYKPDQVDTVMFGDYIKVDFMFEAGIANKDVILPPNSMWLSLFEYDIIFPKDTVARMETKLEHPIILQKEGSIIPIQHILSKDAKSTSGLKNSGTRLSVLLDQTDRIASGHVLIEDGMGAQEYYEVRATRDSISFKQHNEGEVDISFKSKNVEMIRIAAPPMTWASTEIKACAVLQDHHTIKPMYVNAFHNDQLEITPNDPNVAEDKTTLRFDQVAFIYYGVPQDDTVMCDQTLLQGKVKLDVLNGDYSREVIVTQNIHKLASNTPEMDITITLEDDHSIYITMFEQNNDEQIQEARRLRQEKEAKRVSTPAFKLENVVTVNTDPFYIEIHSYVEDPATQTGTVYWSTKDTSFIFGQHYSMFSITHPNTDPQKFFGIGERKGEFFLQDNYQYSMYTNNHNLKDIVQTNGRTVQFCKNGFFPIIFSTSATSNAHMQATYLGEGSRDIFYTQNSKVRGEPMLSMVQMVNFVTMRVMFEKEPTDLMRDVHRSLLTPEHLRIPPTWALGHFHLVRNFNDSGDMVTTKTSYDSAQYPLEGFVLDLNFTGFESLWLSAARVQGGNTEALIHWLNANNLTVWQNLKAGIPKRSTQAGYLIGNNSAIVRNSNFLISSNPVVGLDQQGEVIYANYYQNSFVQSAYFEGAFAHYERTFDEHTYGVQLIHNEIYEPFCTSDCYRDSQYDPMPGQFYKVGIDKQLRNSMSGNSQRNVDTHNGYGYRQHLRLSHADFNKKKFFVSSSNTPGSGKFGNIGRIIDYIDHDDEPTAAVVALQSLSLLGMGAIGEKFGAVKDVIGDKTVNKHIVIQTFSPLAAHQWTNPDPKDVAELNAGHLMRYKYMMIKYTQTQLFKQAIQGDPFIHPLFLDFYNDDNTFNSDVVANQYMYGSFMISIKANVKGENSYFPKGTWCTTSNYNQDPYCLESPGNFIPIQNYMFYFKEGSILPLQDAFGKAYPEGKVVYTTKDLIGIPLDLHMNIMTDDTGIFHSRGQLLLSSDSHDDNPHCYIEIMHNGDTVNFEMTVGRDINECHYEGYKVGRLLIYNPKIFTYGTATINGDQSLSVSLHPGAKGDYSTFDFTTLTKKLNWYEVVLIKFS